MLARHAESLFWTGRYLERAGDTARMLDVTYHGLLESPPDEARRAWYDLLEVLDARAAFEATHGEPDAASVSRFLVLDPGNDGSIVSTVGRARESARSVREMISTELWEAVNTFYLELFARNLRHDLEQQPYELYGMVKRRCQGVAGTAVETMPRDDGWRFLMLGWMLERAEMTCRLLNVRFAQLVEADPTSGFHDWIGALKSASASEAYRKAYRASMDRSDVVEFLLLSRTFPRSVLYCLEEAERFLGELCPPGELTHAQRLLGRVRADVQFVDVHELIDRDLHDFLDGAQFYIRGVAELVATQFFRHHVDLELHALGRL